MHPGNFCARKSCRRSTGPRRKSPGFSASRQTLYDVLKERQPVTPVMALRLGKLCGNGPDLWLNLQKRYDLHLAEQELGAQIKRIPTLQVA